MFYCITSLIEKYNNQSDIFKIAKIILRTQDIRELSYNKNTNGYNLTINNAAEMAFKEIEYVDPTNIMLNIITNLNEQYWNDIQYWAESKIKEYNNNIIENNITHIVSSCENCLIYNYRDEICLLYPENDINLNKIPNHCVLYNKCIIIRNDK